MSAAASIIAVPEMGENASGAIVFWRLTGAIDYDDLEQAWAIANLPKVQLPSPVTPLTALKRTMATFKSAGTFSRPMRGGEQVGFVLVDEHYGVDGLPTYKTSMAVCYDTTTDALIVGDGSTDTEIVRQVRATWARHLAMLSAQDISHWLVHLIRSVEAVRLRDTGGIYFVPRTHLAQWRAYVGAIRASAGCALFEIPAMQSAEAVNAILDALTTESQEAIDSMVEEIDAWSDPNARSINVRTARLGALSQKLESYEGLLGVKLDALRTQCEQVSARLVEAALIADAG